ncbi:MAG TPA: hypothetical protein VK617_12360 [Gemmatimonadaceae bacterium]|nr:hypothetical protein [Gemmatimonadaceae bacterium]
MSFRVGSAFCFLATTVGLLMAPVPQLYAQDQCQCSAPGSDDSRIANAIGGGLFAGLIAAVIPFRHAAALASAPPAAGAPSALTTMSDSTDIAPTDSMAPRRVASGAIAPNGSRPDYAADGLRPLARTSRGETAAALPSMTPSEAEADGMIAPRTATILPALAMLGIGAMLIGIIVLRIRQPRFRSR